MPVKSHIQAFMADNFRCPAQTFTSSGAPRMQFVDLAKGICILLVVWSHCSSDFSYNPRVLMHLRMPLYFVLSGLFFKDYNSFLALTEKKINKLIVPFIAFAFMGALINALIWGYDSNEYSLLNILYDVPIGNFPTWFLLSLFWCNIIFCIITRNISGEILRLACVFLCAIVGFILLKYRIEPLPKFNQALISMPMYVSGYFLRRSPLMSNKELSNNWLISMGLFLFAVGIILFEIFGGMTVTWITLEYSGSWFLLYLLPLFMVTGLLMLCRGIGGWVPVISYIGRYSIIVLVTHWFYILYVYVPIYLVTGITIGPFLIFLLTVLLSWLSIPVLKAWVPGLVAQKEWVRLPRIENLRKMVRVAK